ncbi:MAG: DUF1850 domain-containing protein [Thermoprotei archaeon]
MQRLIVIITTIIFLIIIFTPVIPVLKVSVDGKRFFIFSQRIVVNISYMHSVELLRINETFVLKNNEFYLKTLKWPGYGAGLASSTNDLITNSTMRVINGEYVLDNLNVSVGSMISINTAFMISPNITVNGMEINGKDITLEVEKINLFELLYIKFKGDIYE